MKGKDCKVWVSFNWPDVLDKSKNVKNVSRNGIGDYTIKFKVTLIGRIRRLYKIWKWRRSK